MKQPTKQLPDGLTLGFLQVSIAGLAVPRTELLCISAKAGRPFLCHVGFGCWLWPCAQSGLLPEESGLGKGGWESPTRLPCCKDLKEILGNDLAGILETAMVQKGLRRERTALAGAWAMFRPSLSKRPEVSFANPVARLRAHVVQRRLHVCDIARMCPVMSQFSSTQRNDIAKAIARASGHHV